MANVQSNLKDIRVGEYAAGTFTLDLLQMAKDHYELDMESIWIIFCIMHNMYRGLMVDPELSPHLDDWDAPITPKCSLSRRAIADKTGLSRETVRRRTNKLIGMGLVIESSNGALLLASYSPDVGTQQNLDLVQDRVNNFLGLLHSFNVQTPFNNR